jgi:SPW repeat
MGKWTHPQGWVALVVGVYAALSPIWTTHPTGNKALWTMIVLGVVTAVLALLSLADLGRVISDGLIALMGVLFIISPFVMSFTVGDGYKALAWTAWIVGIVALVAGAWDAQVTRTQQQAGHNMVTGH